jgi:uncharacterized protein (TIGR02001 family)
MLKKILVLASLAAIGGAALADDGLTANVTVASKYKYRGQDQSDTAKDFLPAIQGGFDYTKGAFYLGNWNSSIGFAGGTEMDFYGGYKGEAAGMAYDLGVLQYYYPGSTSVFNTTELYGALTYGIATGKLSYVASDKYFGAANSRGTLYLDLAANYEIAKSLTLNAHVGFTKLASGSTYGADYADYKLGVTYDYGKGLTAAAAIVGATKDGAAEYGDLNKARVVLSVSKAM